MIKKSVIAICAIFLLVISILNAMQVVDANPYWIFDTIDPIPGAIPPKIIIHAPKNNIIYFSDNIIVNLTVSNPQMGNSELQHYQPEIYSIKYTFDDKFTQEVPKSNFSAQFNYKESCNIALTSDSLSVGKHNFNVTAEGVVLIFSADPQNHSLSKFWITGSSSVLFTIDTQSSELSPTTTTGTLTPTPTTPYLPPNDRNAPHLEPTFYLLPISVIIAIIAIAIFIYRRMKINK